MRKSRIICVSVLFAIAAVAALCIYWFVWNGKILEIRSGMTQAEVRSLVGTPPKIRINGISETWDYTRPFPFYNATAKVHFDVNGIVRWIETD